MFVETGCHQMGISLWCNLNKPFSTTSLQVLLFLCNSSSPYFMCPFSSAACPLSRFLVGNKSDLRDPCRTDGQVSQELAMSFARAHNMMFFETSAKNPPDKCVSGRQGGSKVPDQRDKVEDIVVSVGAKLKRQKKSSAANPPTYNGSFRVTNKKRAEKELWTCCWDTERKLWEFSDGQMWLFNF